jgi:hypothetical protein
MDQARCLHEPERENACLTKLMAEQALDMSILEDNDDEKDDEEGAG